MREMRFVFWVGLWTGIAPVGTAGGRVVADFDMPPPNNLGGAYGVFAPSASETTCVTVETLDENTKHGDNGASMRLDYNVTARGAFNGFWMKLGPSDEGNNFDASGYASLTFWIKGDPGVGIPKSVKVELKGDPGMPAGAYRLKALSSDWKKIEVPLSKYVAQRVNLKKLNEFVLVFEHAEVGPATQGCIWIDDVMFE